ncbi:extracellular serine proteinase-like [Saccoglossus kowalevskii]
MMKVLVQMIAVSLCCELTFTARLLKVANPLRENYIVVMKGKHVDVDSVETRLVSSTKVKINGKIKGKGKMKALRIEIPDDDPESLEKLLQDPAIDYVEEDGVVTPDNWGLDEIDLTPGNGIYDPPGDGSGKTVYIIDSGIYPKHKDWDTSPKLLSNHVTGKKKLGDCYGHGTHVAGIVGSKTYGVAKKAQLSAVVVFDCDGSGTWGRVISGLNTIVNEGVPDSIINLSLAGSYAQAVVDALADANDAGFLIVTAAGNANVDGCTMLPANSTDVIAVGATMSDGYVWPGSNYGPCVDMYAPGAGILSLDIQNPSSTTVKTGTSMASPEVAGMAAVLWSLNPTYTNAQIRDLIFNDAIHDEVLGLDATSHNVMACF